jgi:hypothetical protein
MPTFDEIPAQMTVEPGPTAASEDVVSLETASEVDAIEQPAVKDQAAETGDGEPPMELEAPSEPAHGDEPAEAPAPEASDVVAAEEPTQEGTLADVAEEPQPSVAQHPPDDDLWDEAQPEPEPRVKPPSRPSAPGELPERRVVVIDDHPDIDIEAGKEAPPPPPGPPEHGMGDIGETLDDEKGRKRRWRMFRKGGDR